MFKLCVFAALLVVSSAQLLHAPAAVVTSAVHHAAFTPARTVIAAPHLPVLAHHAPLLHAPLHHTLAAPAFVHAPAAVVTSAVHHAPVLTHAHVAHAPLLSPFLIKK